MSTPLSSVAPRSSSLAVPSTQNTAPVVKFRCLFTHDIRRKAKRWQDGFLRYHTFNKRVMVYDNTGYFIGDLHWRAPEGINDGDELELDKGVLIQVCEPLERTETDLSSLYKNKNQASPSRRGDAPPSSVHSAAFRSSVSSQQASRSLNDLLGIKKTPVPQLPSPYEQRHGQKPISMHRLHERPAKRQRISPEPITSGQQDVVNLSDSPPPRRQNTNTQSRPNPHSISQNRRTAVLPEPQLSTGPHSTSETQAPPSSGRPTAQSVSQNLKASSSGAGSSVSTLRLSGSKPRRKLMYQEASLAPVKKTGSQDPLPRADSQRQTIKQAASSHVIVLDGDSPKLDNDPIADDDSILDDDDLFSAIQTTVPHQENPALDDDSPKLDDDPIPDDDSILDDDNVFSDLQTTVPHQENPAQVDSDSSLSRIHPPNNNVEGSVNPKTCAPNPAATELPPELNNSNNTIPLPRSDPPLPTGQHNTKILENIARPRSTGLRKSYSDPTTINSLHTRPLPTTSPLNPSVNKDDEQGPWTSEALDLFDFWPPGRPKPT